MAQGRDNVKKLFEDNPEFAAEIEDKIMAIVADGVAEISSNPTGDDAIEIMPEEPTARPRKSVDIDIAVDE